MTDHPNDYSIARLADRAQIQDVMLRWCRAVDRLDFDAIRGVFHPDGIDAHGIYHGGVDGLIDWIRERHKGISFSMHVVSNMLIEFAGPDTALAETYCFATQRYRADGGASLAQVSGGRGSQPGTGTDVLAWARYVDRFERRSGEWRIAHRTVVYDVIRAHEVSADSPVPDPKWTCGRRDGEDFVFRARRELGIAK